jgi:hypothetical protein
VKILVTLALLVSSMSYADEFGGWKYTPPAGAKKVTGKGAVTFTAIDNTAKTFCQYGLYTARAPGNDDVNQEWKEIVEPNYTIVSASDPVTAKVKNVSLTARTATVKKDGGTYVLAHYVLQPAGGVSSLVLVSTNEASIAQCPIRAFLDSISLAKAPAPVAQPAPAPAPAPGQQAGAPSLARVWSTGSSVYIGGVSQGSVKRQYTFNTDGTYQYFRETWGGSNNSTWWFTMLETGTWKLAGDQLTLAPKKVVGNEYNKFKGTQRPVKVPVEPATYTVKTVWMSGLEMWNLVMTIDKPTNRDGAFASNASYPNSYLLDTRNNIEFQFPPK